MSKIFAAIFVLVLLGVGGWYLMNQSRTPPTGTPHIVPTPTTEESSNTTTINDIDEGVSFEIPKDWKKVIQDESGYPSYVSPGFSNKAMSLKGSFIAYHLYSPPAQFKDKPDEYLSFLKENSGWPGSTDWKEFPINGYTLWKLNLPENQLNKKTVVIGRIGDRFLDIIFADATNSYTEVFNAFLSSFKVN